MTDTDKDTWSARLFDHLIEAGVRLFAYVPDAGNARLIELAEAHNEARPVLLASEQEGVAICAGADLVGGRAVLCMQSSGLGNCPNFLSLVKGGGFPVLLIVSMRGDYGEQNPWQIPMGQGVRPVMEAMGMHCLAAERPDEVIATATAAIDMAYRSNAGVGMLLGQRLLGAKAF